MLDAFERRHHAIYEAMGMITHKRTDAASILLALAHGAIDDACQKAMDSLTESGFHAAGDDRAEALVSQITKFVIKSNPMVRELTDTLCLDCGRFIDDTAGICFACHPHDDA